MNNHQINRRHFIGMMAGAAGVACLSPHFALAGQPLQGQAFAGQPVSTRKIRLGVVGGNFGLTFHFDKHPNCTVEAISDLIPERRQALMDTYQCKKSYKSLELLLRDRKIEAVGLFTPAPDHARHTIQALKAGKHVLCAVPAAMTLEEARQVQETVKRTGLTYMMAETSTYFQTTITAKKFYKEGLFGKILHTLGQYHHTGALPRMYDKDGKPTWRCGLPPMLYPTHVTSLLIAVTGERLTSVCCNGWGDKTMPYYKNNPYKNNPFDNCIGFFRTDRGNILTGERLRVGPFLGVERGEWHGDKMSYCSDHYGFGDHRIHVTKELTRDHGGFLTGAPRLEPYPRILWYNTDMLPETMRGFDSGHEGSHTFITHEFIDSLIHGREPEVNIREALAYTVPGIIAHESALKDGELMKIPSFD